MSLLVNCNHCRLLYRKRKQVSYIIKTHAQRYIYHWGNESHALGIFSGKVTFVIVWPSTIIQNHDMAGLGWLTNTIHIHLLQFFGNNTINHFMKLDLSQSVDGQKSNTFNLFNLSTNSNHLPIPNSIMYSFLILLWGFINLIWGLWDETSNLNKWACTLGNCDGNYSSVFWHFTK